MALLLALAYPAPSHSSEIESKPADQLKKVRVNGVELHYLQQGEGTPVIFVHGGVEDYRLWKSEMKPFSESYSAIAYSRRYNYPNHNPVTRSDHSAIGRVGASPGSCGTRDSSGCHA